MKMVFFSSRRRHKRCGRYWSSDVCSSDLFFPQFNQVVETNALYYTFFPVPENAVQFVVSVFPNNLSPDPFPDVTIYLKNGDTPTTTSFDVKGTNSVSLPPDGTLAAPATWFIGVADPTG